MQDSPSVHFYRNKVETVQVFVRQSAQPLIKRVGRSGGVLRYMFSVTDWKIVSVLGTKAPASLHLLQLNTQQFISRTIISSYKTKNDELL